MNPILKRTLTGLAVGAVVIFAVLFAPPVAIMPAAAVLAMLAIAEFCMLYSGKVRLAELRGLPLLAAFLGYIAGCAVIAGGLWALASVASRYGDATCGALRLGNVMLLYVVAIIKFSDVGGFAFGLSSAKLMKGGNHKMCPGVSPNKSWEGLFGSVLFSSIVSCSFMGATGFGWGKSIACGVVAALVGTAGDLVESKFKRWVGVKDSSAMKITNGMGGFLDMFDSLLFAPAVLIVVMGMEF